MHGLLYSSLYIEVLKYSFTPMYLLSQPFCSVCCLSRLFSLAQAPISILFLVNAFNKCHPRSFPSPGNALSQQNKDKPLHYSLRKVPESCHNKQWQFFERIMSVFLPLALTTCTKSVGCHLHGCFQTPEWGMVSRQFKMSQYCLTTTQQLLSFLSSPLVVVSFLLDSGVLKNWFW